jgi:hypothetical protein
VAQAVQPAAREILLDISGNAGNRADPEKPR